MPRGEAAGGADRAAMWRFLLARPKHPGVASCLCQFLAQRSWKLQEFGCQSLANSIEVWFEQDEVSNRM